MRKVLLIAASLLVVTAATAAQHGKWTETPVKGGITLSSDVTIGTSVLKAGDYRYACDRENLTFKNPQSGIVVLKVPCMGRELPVPAAETVLQTTTTPDGKKVASKLLLKGSNVEHVFQ